MSVEHVDLAGLAVRGVSIGGVETSIEVPSWGLGLDVGRGLQSAARLSTILFTHAHADHMGGVVMHCALRALRRLPPPRYVVPREDADAFRDLFDAWRRLDRSELAHRVVPLGPGEELRLGRDRVARAFHSPHRAPCQGYVIYAEHARLRPEFVGTPGEELARRRREGVEIAERRRVPELAFTGDARVEVLDREPELYRCRRLILEATFLDDRVDAHRARRMGHVHLDDVIERAAHFQNEAILLTHFSARYRKADVRRILDRRLPPSLRERVVPLLKGFGESE